MIIMTITPKLIKKLKDNEKNERKIVNIFRVMSNNSL
jgi:hypothetical protein